MWFCLYAFDKQRRVDLKEGVRAALLGLLPYAAVIGLRFWFGGARAVTENTQSLTFLADFLGSISRMGTLDPFDWPLLAFAMFGLWIMWLLSNRQHILSIQHRLLWASLLVAVASLVFGRVNELRIFIPTLTILAIVAVWVEVQSGRASGIMRTHELAVDTGLK